MTAPATWHPFAKQLRRAGHTVKEIAARLGLNRRTVQKAIYPQNASPRTRKALDPKSVAPERRGRAKPVHRVQRHREAAPEPLPDLTIGFSRKPTLPHISISAVSDRPIIRKYAPPIRKEMPSEGVERWRFHHLKMIREGRIPAPGLPEQLHH